jgi:hypothetical protein
MYGFTWGFRLTLLEGFRTRILNTYIAGAQIMLRRAEY